MQTPAFPSTPTIALLRAALRRLEDGASFHTDPRAGGGTAAPPPASDLQFDELGAALTALCYEAHTQALRPEQLLIAFKDMWRTLPEVRAIPNGPARDALLSRVIGVCLDEFYRET